MRLFLLGFMGAGKSYLGRQLHKQIGYPFWDLDDVIETMAGQSIADIFDQLGASHFRRLEEQALKSMKEWEKVVVATGGGAPCFFENMEWMNANGITVYLKIAPQLLATRLLRGRAHRPLIRDFNEDELIQYIHSKLEEREAYYLQAQYILTKELEDEELLPRLLQIISPNLT